jgi:hypothetical protein
MTLIITRYKDKAMLEEENFTARFGVLCDGVNISKSIGAYWTVLTLLRLVLTVGVLVGLRDYGQN